MDGTTFDRLSQRFGRGGSRRGLLGLFTALPLAGAVTHLQDEESKAAKRRKRHKRHKKHHKHKCRPDAVDQVCAGKCSFVTNNCGDQVDCGPCSCAAGCPRCQTCDTTTGLCVADPAQNRTVCDGSAGATSVCCQGTCCSGCCGAGGVCEACLAFVTSTTQNAVLGGLTGADAICQARAAAGGLPGASEPGTYKAWLSDDTGSPTTRFRCTQDSCSSQGYKRVDDVSIASDWSTLTDGTLKFGISVTELNRFVRPDDSLVWSNTTTDGTQVTPVPDLSFSCGNWTSLTTSPRRGRNGIATSSDATWTDDFYVPCDLRNRLYCFQQS